MLSAAPEKISHDMLMSIARDNAIKHVLVAISSAVSIVSLNSASSSSVSEIFESSLYATSSKIARVK